MSPTALPLEKVPPNVAGPTLRTLFNIFVTWGVDTRMRNDCWASPAPPIVVGAATRTRRGWGRIRSSVRLTFSVSIGAPDSPPRARRRGYLGAAH